MALQVTFGNRGPRRVYHIMDWTLDYSDASSITCRPGSRTLLTRTLLAAVPLGVITWTLLSLQGMRDPVVMPLRVLGGGLAALAALYILSGFWQRIRIYRSGEAKPYHGSRGNEPMNSTVRFCAEGTGEIDPARKEPPNEHK